MTSNQAFWDISKICMPDPPLSAVLSLRWTTSDTVRCFRWVFERPRFQCQFFWFDGLCVHQTNLPLKTKTLQAVPAFVAESAEMLVVWDQTLFTHLAGETFFRGLGLSGIHRGCLPIQSFHDLRNTSKRSTHPLIIHR